MKRAFIIGTGAVCSLGAVLLITPPQIGSSSSSLSSGGITTTGLLSKTSSTSTTTGSTTSASKSTATTSSASTTSSTTTSKGISGTFVGATAQTIYGPVQVQITVSNGKITEAKALTYPTESFRDQQINSQAIPYLQQETIQAQSANIQGVGGASYTTQGWISSLQSALSKAGI